VQYFESVAKREVDDVLPAAHTADVDTNKEDRKYYSFAKGCFWEQCLAVCWDVDMVSWKCVDFTTTTPIP
jgi:hypothetical protein